MKNIGYKMHGLSLHYYTIKEWNNKGSATNFSAEDYYETLSKSAEIEEVIQKHSAIMDKYDRNKRIALMVDEWGTWFDVEPNTNPGFLYQQNTMRDAFVAALTLHIFNRHSDRISMANIAQVANVLQSMILTKDDKLILTPTYHVFEMYKVHQDATLLPLEIISGSKEVRGRPLPLVSASASQKNGVTHITLANIDLENAREVVIDIPGLNPRTVKGRILTSAKINDCNTFEKPDTVTPREFKDAKITAGKLTLKLPAKSIIVLEL
jgi:alpha-N-arabinofuranosidase